MTTISKDAKLVTLISVFTVEPATHQRLVELLAHVTNVSVRHAPGFIARTTPASAGTAPDLRGGPVASPRTPPSGRASAQAPTSCMA
jgi:hypothetical protein